MTEPASKVRWSIPNSLRVLALLFTLFILMLFLWQARSLFLTTFLGVIFGLALARAADFLKDHHIRRAVGAPLVMMLVIGALVTIIALIAPSLRTQMRDISSEFPKALQEIEVKLGIEPGTVSSAVPGAEPPPGQGQQKKKPGVLQQSIQREAKSIGRMMFPVVASSAEAIAGLLIMIFIAIYIGINPGMYRNGILHLVPHEKRPRAGEVLSELTETLRGWLLARLMAVVIIGAITAIGLMALKVKAALALGLIAGLLEFIPFFGPILSAIPAIAIAMIDSPQKALYVMILYVLIQQLEGNVVTPLLLKKRLDVPPVLTIVAVSALGIVFGVLGMLVAEPLVATILLLVKRLYVEDVVGDDVSPGSA